MPYESEAVQKATQESAAGAELTDEVFEEIVKEIEETLVLPTQKHQPQIILCPVGLVGSGKTTVIKLLSARLGLVRISGDEIRRQLQLKDYNLLRTLEIADSLAKKYIDLGYSIGIDSDCAGNGKDLVRANTEEHPDIRIIWIHVQAPEPLILERLRIRHQPSDNAEHHPILRDADHAIANYLRRKPLHEHLDFPFLYTFDMSRDDLAKQIDEAVEMIEKIK